MTYFEKNGQIIFFTSLYSKNGSENVEINVFRTTKKGGVLKSTFSRLSSCNRMLNSFNIDKDKQSLNFHSQKAPIILINNLRQMKEINHNLIQTQKQNNQNRVMKTFPMGKSEAGNMLSEML